MKKICREEKYLLFLITPMVILAIVFFCLAALVDRNKINGLELTILLVECLLFGLFSRFIKKYNGGRWTIYMAYAFGISLAVILVITFGITATLIGSLIYWVALKIKKRKKQKSESSKKSKSAKKSANSGSTFKPGLNWPVQMSMLKN